jgi:membrane fusion protein, macrolide-specific efflux system
MNRVSSSTSTTLSSSFASSKSTRRKWILSAVILIAAIAGYFIFKNKTPETQYREVVVTRGALNLFFTAIGSVQPENRLEIKPPVAGRIDEVLVNEGQKVNQGQILAWMSSTERAALLDAARAQGTEEVARWKQIYRPTPVVAPIKGTIILRSIEAGQTFSNTDSILVMSDRLTVKALVDETDIARIKLKQPAQILLDAYPDQPIEGMVDKIAFEASTVNNVTSYIVDILPRAAPDHVRSGMTATVKFAGESRADILLLPTEALKSENGKNFVLKAASEKNQEPKLIEVSAGLTDGKLTEVLSGVSEGERVAIEIPKEKKKSNGSPFSPMGRGKSGSGRK